MFLCRFAYFSRRIVSCACALEDDPELQAILAAGLRNNPERGLSGVLVADGDLFVQVLEGPRTTLSQTFCRIQQDDRHAGLVLAGFTEVAQRAFEDWRVLVRDTPGSLKRLPWNIQPETATFGTLVEDARRLLNLDHEFKVMRPRDVIN